MAVKSLATQKKMFEEKKKGALTLIGKVGILLVLLAIFAKLFLVDFGLEIWAYIIDIDINFSAENTHPTLLGHNTSLYSRENKFKLFNPFFLRAIVNH